MVELRDLHAPGPTLHFSMRNLRLRELRLLPGVSQLVSTELELGPSSANSPPRGQSKIKSKLLLRGLQDGFLAIHLSPERQATGNLPSEAIRPHLPVSLFLVPYMSRSLHCWPFLWASFYLDLPALPSTCPATHLLDVARCLSHGPRAQALLPSHGCFLLCQLPPPPLIFRACHSQLPASHYHGGLGRK